MREQRARPAAGPPGPREPGWTAERFFGVLDALAPLRAVCVDEKGSMTVAGERLTYDDVTRLLQTLAAQERNLEIRTDAAARHGDVIRILDLAGRFDLRRIGIAFDPRE